MHAFECLRCTYLTCRLEVLRLWMQGRHGEFQPGKARYSTPNFFDRLLARPRTWGPSQPWRPWDGDQITELIHLTLSQPGGGHIIPAQYYVPPWIFRPCDGPALMQTTTDQNLPGRFCYRLHIVNYRNVGIE